MGSSHRQHHYVPAFLLREWERGVEPRLVQFARVQGRLLASPYKAKSVAKEEYLYATGMASGTPDVSLERDYLGPEVDDRAAVSHQLLLQHKRLTAQQSTDWVRFLAAALLRHPDSVAFGRGFGPSLLEQYPDVIPERGEVFDPTGPHLALQKWLQSRPSDMGRDLSMKLLPSLIDDPQFHQSLLGEWLVLDFSTAPVELLIADRPLIYNPNPNKQAVLYALPLSPKKCFFSLIGPGLNRHINTMSKSTLARRLNKAAVQQAVEYVYAADTSQQAFVERHLGALPGR